MEPRIRSMTGFGEANAELSERYAAHVRLTSVNSRHLEVSVRTQPRLDLSEAEAAVRATLAESLSRGRVQVAVQLQSTGISSGGLGFHWEIAEALARELGRRPPELDLAPLTLRDLLSVPGFMDAGEAALTGDERDALLHVIAEARDALVATRETEGAALLPQIDRELDALESFAEWLAAVNAQLRASLLERLRDRLSELLGGVTVPEDRLLTEAALAADRADVSEEVERLRAHIAHFHQLIGGGGPVGKQLDFLIQEVLREVNTSGSKCREVGMGERVVEAKAALERLREQVANLE